MCDLQPHGPDTYVGIGPRYPWGGLYGGQIVAQALRAAAATVEAEFDVHSLRAYFIRRGDHAEPVRYEVDRIRNGRSFVTRRVVARQAVGAILNLEASFQRDEQSPVVQTVTAPRRTWRGRPEDGAAHGPEWMQVTSEVNSHREGDVDGDLPDDPAAQLLQRCCLAYLSDDVASDSAHRVHPRRDDPSFAAERFGASLDHTIWFHRPLRADRWHLHDVTCHAFAGNRGLTLGQAFAADGTHVATFA